MSGLLEQFFIKYLTNAKEAAKDVRELDAANNKLTDDIKKQTEEEKKRNQELEKTARAMSDLVSNVTAAAAAYVGLNAVKNGIIKSADFNNTLALESKLLGQNAQDIASYGASLQQFGGNAQDFQGWLHGLTMEYAAMGREIPKVETLMKSINREIAGKDRTSQLFTLNRYGITNSAQQQALMQSPEAFDAMLERQRQIRPINEDAAKASREWAMASADLGNALGSIYDVIVGGLLPSITEAIKWVTEFITEHRTLSTVLLSVATAITTIIGLISAGGMLSAIGKAIPLVGTLATAFRGVAMAIASIGTALLANPVVLAVLGIGAAGYAAYKMTQGSESSGAIPRMQKTEAAMKAMQFWKSQGYTDAQAAGWVANMMAESNGNPNARGDNGQAAGLFQWHPDRQRNIMNGTGIDIRTASFEDQLKAAAWEAEKRGDAFAIKQAQNEQDAAAIISTKYERPFNRDFEAMKRAQMASDYLKSTNDAINMTQNSGFAYAKGLPVSSNTRNATLNVGGVTVNTQATDPQAVAQATSDAIHSQFNSVMSNYDTAEAY